MARRDLDLCVVGAGIVGLAVARELQLRHPGARVEVLEAESAVATHQTSHSSGVVHAGVYYAPGSLKARLCVEGARRLYDYCERRGIAHERCGKAIVATRREEVPALDDLERRGRANGVRGLKRIGPRELGEVEPHVRGVAALHSPDTGIVDFGAVAAALAHDVREAGGEVRTGFRVTGVEGRPGSIRLVHEGGQITARGAVFCAGLQSDRLAVADGADPDPRIVPFRGAYLRLRPERAHLVRSLVYPVPDPRLPFLGVHLTRGTSGEVLVGPTALLSPGRAAYRLRDVSGQDLRATLGWPGTWRMARRFARTGAGELRMALDRGALVRAAAAFVPELRDGDVEPGPAGIRAQAVARDGTLVDDFVFSETPRALHLRNAPSPAATSALAIADLVAERMARSFDL